MGKLGRDRVCCIRTEDVEIASDYHGVVYLTYRQSINNGHASWVTRFKQA